jgi:hypothetical protein
MWGSWESGTSVFVFIGNGVCHACHADALGAGVNVEAGGLGETDEGGAELFGNLNGEAGGGADGDEHGDAGGEGFLHQLETGAAAEDEDGAREVSPPLQKLVADNFVDSIVATDILANDDTAALWGEEAGGMKTTGALEDLLLVTEAGGKGADDLLIGEPAVRGEDGEEVKFEGFHGGLAADAATGGGVAVPLKTLEVEGDAGLEGDADAVLEAMGAETGAEAGNGVDLVERTEEAFAYEETDGQLAVVARGTHGDGDGFGLASVLGADDYPHIERLFQGQLVGAGFDAGTAEAFNGASYE